MHSRRKHEVNDPRQLRKFRAAGSRPSLMSVVKLLINNSRTKRAAIIWTMVFLAVRRRSHCTSASNWDSQAWKFSHTESKSYACALRCVPWRFSNLDAVFTPLAIFEFGRGFYGNTYTPVLSDLTLTPGRLQILCNCKRSTKESWAGSWNEADLHVQQLLCR